MGSRWVPGYTCIFTNFRVAKMLLSSRERLGRLEKLILIRCIGVYTVRMRSIYDYYTGNGKRAADSRVHPRNFYSFPAGTPSRVHTVHSKTETGPQSRPKAVHCALECTAEAVHWHALGTGVHSGGCALACTGHSSQCKVYPLACTGHWE